MKRIALVLALAATLALAGCLGGGGSDADAGAASDGADGGSGSDDGPGQTGGSDAGSDDGAGTSDAHWNATLEEAPPWEPGQWWTAKVTDVNNDETYTVKQVVASQHGKSYDVGLAAEDFSTPVVIAHWPPIGELGTDLTYPIHNEIFKPVQFPLQEGDTWETTYLGTQEVTAEVTSVDGTKAEIAMMEGENDTAVTLTYDAEMETITKLEDDLGLTYEIIDHGHGYTGDVVVPHGKSQYISARVAGAFGLGGPVFGLGPAPPTGSVDVSEPQASAALLAGSVTIDGTGPPGAYQETVHTPDGESHTLRSTGTNGFDVQYVTIPKAQGTWDFEHVAGGAGVAGTEIVAYEKLTVTLTGDEAASGSSTAS